MGEDIIDILLDEDNKDSILLTDEKGNKIAFEQVAVIPYDQKIYCILKPIAHMDNVADDEAIVFYVEEDLYVGNAPVLRVEADEFKAIDVFEKYYDLLDSENK